jgi:hypothetical protein
MPESESFDAFYARTVWNVTSQMHALAEEDSLADHAIREAYARAYQQWYEVSGYRDSEAWVLGVAKDAYERRRADAAVAGDIQPAAGHDPLTWPGMFRPASPKASPPADPEATLAPHLSGTAGTAGPGVLGGAAGPAEASAVGEPAAALVQAGSGAPGPLATDAPPGSLFGSPAAGRPAAGSPSSGVTADWAPPGEPAHGVATVGEATYGDPAAGGAALGWGAPAGAMHASGTGERHGAGPTSEMPPAKLSSRPPRGRVPVVLGSRRKLVAVAAAAAILLAGGIVYAVSSPSTHRGATPGASKSAVAKPTVRMLPYGRTGSRATIPWSLIGPGWALAEVSTARPDADGAAAGSGRYVTYLVDPQGGKYRIVATSGPAAPDLLAWSGNGKTALYAAGGGQAGSYGLLNVASGQLTSLPLPAGVTALGFTRPEGLNIVAVRQKQDKYLLERYTLAGAHAATLGTLPRPAGATDILQGNALSSPDGTTVVWGVSGHEMQLVSNAGGLIRRLRVPAGSPPSCTPISWWTSQTVLAFCNAAGTPDAGRLWLVPAGGGAPAQLTGVSGSPSGVGDLTGAWQAGGSTYITATTSAQCSGAASGPGGQQILQLGQSGAESPVSITGSMNNHATVIASAGKRLLVLAQTSCPGTSSLIWLSVSPSTARTVLQAPAAGEVGVVSAVPYGSGPAAATNGLN